MTKSRVCLQETEPTIWRETIKIVSTQHRVVTEANCW